MDVPRPQPFTLAGAIDPKVKGSHLTRRITHEPMTCGQVTVGRDTEVAGSGTAGIWTVRPQMDLAKRSHQIGEGIGFAPQDSPLEFLSTGDHAVQHGLQASGVHFAGAG